MTVTKQQQLFAELFAALATIKRDRDDTIILQVRLTRQLRRARRFDNWPVRDRASLRARILLFSSISETQLEKILQRGRGNDNFCVDWVARKVKKFIRENKRVRPSSGGAS